MVVGCSFIGCLNTHHAKGYCSGHYSQIQRGVKLTRLQPRRSPKDVLYRNSFGDKQCVTCSEWKPVNEYQKEPRTGDKLRASCRECVNLITRLYKYNISLTELHELLETQDYGCAICRVGLHPTAHIDHNHACCPGKGSCGKCVRGILCNSCNTALGSLREDPEIIRNALSYLERSK